MSPEDNSTTTHCRAAINSVQPHSKTQSSTKRWSASLRGKGVSRWHAYNKWPLSTLEYAEAGTHLKKQQKSHGETSATIDTTLLGQIFNGLFLWQDCFPELLHPNCMVSATACGSVIYYVVGGPEPSKCQSYFILFAVFGWYTVNRGRKVGNLDGKRDILRYLNNSSGESSQITLRQSDPTRLSSTSISPFVLCTMSDIFPEFVAIISINRAKTNRIPDAGCCADRVEVRDIYLHVFEIRRCIPKTPRFKAAACMWLERTFHLVPHVSINYLFRVMTYSFFKLTKTT